MASDGSDALAAAISLAETEATMRLAAALGAAGIAAGATTQAAVTQAQADVDVANVQAKAAVNVANIRWQADAQVASIAADASKYGSGLDLEGTEYSSDKQLEGVQVAQQSETGRLYATLQFAQDKWNQVFPLIQGFLQDPSGGPSGGTWGQLAAALGPAPTITQGGVFTPAMIQARINQVYSRADRKAATDLHDTEIDLAGRGFAGSSPLLAILRFEYEAAAIQSSVAGAQEVVTSSVQANLQQILQQQQARQDQYAANEQAYNAASKIAADLAASLFGSVTSMVGAISR